MIVSDERYNITLQYFYDDNEVSGDIFEIASQYEFTGSVKQVNNGRRFFNTTSVPVKKGGTAIINEKDNLLYYPILIRKCTKKIIRCTGKSDYL